MNMKNQLLKENEKKKKAASTSAIKKKKNYIRIKNQHLNKRSVRH